MATFAHLHVHTEYSLLDGAARIPELVTACKEQGMTHLAMTDHGVMYGAVDFYKEAKAQGITPIIGCEVYMAARTLYDMEAQDRESAHLILLCENETGYKNLCKLVSKGFVDGFYYKPRIDYDFLEQYSEGLICLSACLAGDIPKLLRDGRYETAKALALRLAGMFGPNHFFLEVQDHGIPEQREVNQGLLRLSQDTGIPLVATNDVHYVRKEDAAAQDILLCIQTQHTVDEPDRMRFETEEFYLKSPKEMQDLFPWCPDAVERTQTIAEMCRFDFDFSTLHLPLFHAPDGMDNETYLRNLCWEGLARRYDPVTDVLKERLQYELNTIVTMGYVDYFLIVWDFVNYAHTVGIEVGPGRGSGAGSLAAYALGITAVDPIRYNLIFERFLNPERVSMPDFDIDFCYERRGEVIDYVIRKYGADHVAQIITFGTMASRAVIRDVGRALNMSYAEVDAIAKMVPMELGMTLEKALSVSTELRIRCSEDPAAKRLMEMARKLEGLPRHASTHAAGVLITRLPVTEYLPLNRNGDVITTQYPMTVVEQLGLLKMDFLGLRTLTVIRDALDMIEAGRGVKVDFSQMSMDDPAVYAMISQGDTDGVFQMESAGMRSFMRELNPDCFEDIVAGISLYRPGPMDYIPRYVEGKNNPASVHYDHPILENALSVTYGCMVYQEQVMQIVRDMAGYSLGRSDLVRRAMAKKKHDVMRKEREIFIHGLVEDGKVVVPGAVRRGVPAEIANKVFDDMMDFANYAFNKAHAAAYAVVAYRTAWLKVYYPMEFMAALMNSVMGNASKISLYIQYCRRHNIPVYPPHIRSSELKFSVQDGGIRMGLAAVKNVGKGAVEQILQERRARGPYVDLFDFVDRLQGEAVNKRLVESLIKAGAFDNMGATRSQLLAIYEQALDGAQRAKKENLAGQVSLFDLSGDATAPAVMARPVVPQVPEHSLRTLLSMEKEMTGVYISAHPLDEVREEMERFTVHADMFAADEQEEAMGRSALEDGQVVQIGGIVDQCVTKLTKKNDTMAFITLEDLYGEVEVIVFPAVYRRVQRMVQPDQLIKVMGRVSLREGEAGKLIAQDIYLLTEDTKEVQPGNVKPALQEAKDFRLCLKIPRAARPALLGQIQDTLARYPGDVPVFILEEASGKKYRVKDVCVTAEQVLQEALHQLLPASCIVLQSIKGASS